MSPAALAGSLVGVVVTLALFSYLIGDNVLFRFVVRIFIGAVGGYTVVLVFLDVIKPHIWDRLATGAGVERVIAGMLFLLGVFVLIMFLPGLPPRLAAWGKPGLGYLAGVGAATVIGGALSGTLIPQTLALTGLFDAAEAGGGNALPAAANGMLILLGTIATLAAFQFRRDPEGGGRFGGLYNGIRALGETFLAIALGCTAAGIILAGLSALAERAAFISRFAGSLFR